MALFGLTKPLERRFERLEERLESLVCVIDDMIRESRAGISAMLERIDAVMATFQEFREALNDQNQAILQEVQEINNKLAQAGNVPQDVMDSLRANTQAIRDIVNEPLPEPTPEPAPAPEPTPQPAPERRR